jgi:hypothetical protein
MSFIKRAAALAALVTFSLLGSGCTELVLLHVYEKVTEGDPAPCHRLNSVDRALQERCMPFQPGSIVAKDVPASGMPVCPLTVATRNPKFWPVLPELIAQGASPESCRESPWVALAQANACPDFQAAPPEQVRALRWLAEVDANAIQHDVVRVLSCPKARLVGLDGVLDAWAANGQLDRGQLAFGPLGALHPSHLGSPLALRLEAMGHTAQQALGTNGGQLAPGFDEALRTGDFAALDWWLIRVPALANRAPPSRSGQMPWLPLARVLTPSFVPDVDQQRATVDYLLAHGANPWKPLPHDPSQTIVTYARQLHSPLLATLEAPATASARLATGRADAAAAAAAAPGLIATGLRTR